MCSGSSHYKGGCGITQQIFGKTNLIPVSHAARSFTVLSLGTLAPNSRDLHEKNDD